MQTLCTATCTILARLLPGLVHNSCTDTEARSQLHMTGRYTGIQPFSQKSHTPTVPKEFQIGLYDPAEADLEHFWNCCSVGFLGERLYLRKNCAVPFRYGYQLHKFYSRNTIFLSQWIANKSNWQTATPPRTVVLPGDTRAKRNMDPFAILRAAVFASSVAGAVEACPKGPSHIARHVRKKSHETGGCRMGPRLCTRGQQ